MNFLQHIIAKSGWHGTKLLLVVRISPEEKRFSAALVKQHDDANTILDETEGAVGTVMEKWLAAWPATPIILCVDSEEIVSGFVDAQDSDPISSLLGVSVVKKSGFYSEIIASPEAEEIHISVCRKSVAEEVIRMTGKARQRVFHINLGLPVAAFSNQFEAKEIAEAFHSQQIDTQGLDDILKQKSQFVFQQRIFKSSLILLGLTIVMWAGLNAWNMHMQEHIQEANILRVSNKKSLNLIEENRQKIDLQKAILLQANHPAMKASGHSLLIDQIASVCPAEISFSSCLLPPQKKDWKRLGLEGVPSDGLLQGYAKHAPALTHFIASLHGLKNIENLNLLKGDFDRKAGHYPFTLIFDIP